MTGSWTGSTDADGVRRVFFENDACSFWFFADAKGATDLDRLHGLRALHRPNTGQVFDEVRRDHRELLDKLAT